MKRAILRALESGLLYQMAHAGVNFTSSSRVRGIGRTSAFFALASGLPAMAELWITKSVGMLRHLSEPQLQGVPLNVALLWPNVIYGSFTLTRAALAGEKGESVLAPTTAVAATSLDLVLDCYGLDRGLWEWRDGGPYAREIRGPNNLGGIPLVNFAGWLVLVGGVVSLYEYLIQEPRTPSGGSLGPGEKLSVAMLVPYYLLPVSWAIRRNKTRYILYSALFPAAIASALKKDLPPPKNPARDGLVYERWV